MGWLTKALGDPFGTGAQRKANVENYNRYYEALGKHGESLAGVAAPYAAQRRELVAAQGEVLSGYGSAIVASRATGQRGQQAAREAGTAAKGRNASTQINRGLGSSTAGVAVDRNISARSAQAAQSVSARASGGQARLESTVGDRIAALRSLTGNTYVGQANEKGRLVQGKIRTIASKEDVAGQGWLNTWLGAAGSLWGSAASIYSGGAAGGGTSNAQNQPYNPNQGYNNPYNPYTQNQWY